MNVRPTLLLLLLPFSALVANPIVVEATIGKAWEKCLVTIDQDSARVSCAVGYRKLTPLREKVYFFRFPVFVAGTSPVDVKAIQEAFEMRLECGGKLYSPRYVAEDISPLPPVEGTPPPDKITVDFGFSIDAPVEKEFAVTISYRQPLINNLFYYLPLFENGKTPENLSNYSITFVPTQKNILSLGTTHKIVGSAMLTRIEVHPRHDEMMVVKSLPAPPTVASPVR